jgi:hypothetical protein
VLSLDLDGVCWSLVNKSSLAAASEQNATWTPKKSITFDLVVAAILIRAVSIIIVIIVVGTAFASLLLQVVSVAQPRRTCDVTAPVGVLAPLLSSPPIIDP